MEQRVHREPVPEDMTNIHLGITAVKEIADTHADELMPMIKEEGGNIIQPIKEGVITTSQLVSEFQLLAEERGIDLEDFYIRAGRVSFTGTPPQMTTFLQIMLNRDK